MASQRQPKWFDNCKICLPDFFNPLIVLLKKNKGIKVVFTHALRTKKLKKKKKIFISYIKYIKIIKPSKNQVKDILIFQKKRISDYLLTLITKHNRKKQKKQ